MFYPFSNFGAGCEWVENAVGPSIYLCEKDPVTILQGGGWDPKLGWTGADNLASTVMRSPDRPIHSEKQRKPRGITFYVTVSLAVAICISELVVDFLGVLILCYRLPWWDS